MRRSSNVLLVAALAACGDDPIAVRAREGADYNRGALIAAVDRFVADGRTPEAYGVLAREVATLRPGMDSTVAELAELELVSLALAPVTQMQVVSRAEQAERLATTVWPVALAPPFEALAPDGWRDPNEAPVALLEGETAAAYVRRLCDGRYAQDCRHVVPEWQGAILNAEAISRLTARARAAIATCEECAGDKSWRDILSRWETLDHKAVVDRSRCEEIGKLARWPIAGAGSQAWVDVVTVTVEPDGDWLLDETPLARARRVDVLRDRRVGDLLGVHVVPSARLEVLEEVATAARDAGYQAIQVQARADAYPWNVRGYRIALPPAAKKKPRPVSLGRSGDTVQVYARALDLAGPKAQ